MPPSSICHHLTTSSLLPSVLPTPQKEIMPPSNIKEEPPRWLDPVSTAHEDMLAFNQSEHDARCAPPESRRVDELLEDDEETLAQAKAYAKCKWPPRSTRVQKPKPLARNVSGIEQQVLIMAKSHLFAYALVEGVYQTHATYLRWAAIIHQVTWEMELLDHLYQKPLDKIYEIMVNNITMLQGKVKERLREFVACVAGFQHTMKNQKIIERNLIRDYESSEIGHCIALMLFYGPSSVGVIYPDYFWDMPLTVVAFALAIWQFCIEEWANGWRQNGNLGMAAMHEKYKSQLAGLKRLCKVAPRCTHQLQGEWWDYIVEYSGAAFVPDDEPTPSARNSQIWPDTPEPSPISVEEMDACLLETAHQESIRLSMVELAVEELAEPIEEDESDVEAPISRSPSPLPVEYNEDGVVTARSKGKGCAK
ncbi:hypothetical protein OPQ81_000002 [Rhizoctonia solani]|nr:hypothetical protein OPQ81_000002 [Rhizoctonia solani]